MSASPDYIVVADSQIRTYLDHAKLAKRSGSRYVVVASGRVCDMDELAEELNRP